MGWHHWKKKILHGEGRCLAWSEEGAYRNFSCAPCMSPVRSSTSYQGRSAQDPFPSDGHCTPVMKRPCSEGESRVRGTLLSRILETDSGRGINMMQIVGELWFVIFGSPGGASMEELLSQLPEDVIGSGFNKEDPGRAPLPPAFHLQGRHVTWYQQWGIREAEVCAVSEATSFEVSIAMKIYIVIMWVRTL
jgi:hypothetical protein